MLDRGQPVRRPCGDISIAQLFSPTRPLAGNIILRIDLAVQIDHRLARQNSRSRSPVSSVGPRGQSQHRCDRCGIGIARRGVPDQAGRRFKPGGNGQGIAPGVEFAHLVPLDLDRPPRGPRSTGIFLGQQQIELGPGLTIGGAVQLGHGTGTFALECRTDRAENLPVGILARTTLDRDYRAYSGYIGGENIGVDRSLSERRGIVARIDILDQRSCHLALTHPHQQRGALCGKIRRVHPRRGIKPRGQRPAEQNMPPA